MAAVYEVVLTADAELDLQELYDYTAENDAPAKADHFLDRMEQLLASLANLPERGALTKELFALGIREYRETYFKPYRVVYRVTQSDKRPMVYVYLIVDGRRDMQALLQRRMFRA
jgi:toxin ParE1/3/4